MRVTRTITSDLPTFALPTSVSIIVTAVALAAMYLRRDDRVGSFSFAVLAMLASTPVLWDFYFAAVFSRSRCADRDSRSCGSFRSLAALITAGGIPPHSSGWSSVAG